VTCLSFGDVGREERRRASRVGNRVVVGGGSIAGLLAVRVFSDAVDDVAVFDRGAFPADASVRDAADRTPTAVDG
jgi:flavin-dependent dehydrogenase